MFLVICDSSGTKESIYMWHISSRSRNQISSRNTEGGWGEKKTQPKFKGVK